MITIWLAHFLQEYFAESLQVFAEFILFMRVGGFRELLKSVVFYCFEAFAVF